MLKSEGGTMATYYMLFKVGRNNITDTQWFVNHFVDSVNREQDLKWIEQHPLDFEDISLGVFSENEEPFTFISRHRKEKDIPSDWIKVTPNNILGEI